MSTDANETIAFSGPTSDGWYRTQIPDWIALNPDLKDGAYRLYCILRALILEKQKNKIRVLSHEQIAFLAVGKNGKPCSVSTVKALLVNLQEVGLVTNPDGSRIVTSSGPGTIQSRRRYQLSDWPDAEGAYAGWRNAFDKLDAFTDDWREARTDVSPGRLEGQNSDLDSQKSDEDGQKTDVDGQNSGENPTPTSDDVPSLKEVPEGDALTSSSSAEVQDITHEAAPTDSKKKTSKPQDREQAKTLIGERFPDGTNDERDQIIDLVYAEAAAKGVKIGFIATYIGGRPAALLEQDLAQVRRHSAAPTVTECGDHHQAMPVYGCPLCAGEIKAGDPEDLARLRAHLALVGSDARPDLARLLGAPVTPVDNVRSLDEGERIRRMQRRPSGVVGGSRTPLPPHSEYQRLTGMTSDQIGAEML